MRRRGFSILELLVVIGVIGIIVSIAMPAVQKARSAVNRIECLNNLKQVGLALHAFHSAHGQFPPLPAQPTGQPDPNALLGWMALILPQLEQEPLYQVSAEACQADPEPLDDPPHVGLATVIKTYVCPEDSRLQQPLADSYGIRAAFSSYIGIGGAVPEGATVGLKGVLGFSPGIRLTDITDGTSQTVMVGERPPPRSLQAGWWYPGIVGDAAGFRGPNNVLFLNAGALYAGDPCVLTGVVFGYGTIDNPCDRYHLWSLHPGGANFLFADASARFLPFMSSSIVAGLASKSGGEVFSLPVE